MKVSVVFTENVEGIAKRGDVKVVAAGFARNFLFPKGFAEAGTPEAIRRVEAFRMKLEKQEKDRALEASVEAQALREREVRIKVREKDGVMFGSITAKDIVNALAKDGVVVKESQILLPKPLKKLGEHEIEADFGFDIKVSFTVILKGE